jgi:hypothetical protein
MVTYNCAGFVYVPDFKVNTNELSYCSRSMVP